MLLLGAAFALVGLGSWGHLDPQDYVLVDLLLDHVFVFGVVAALLAGAALARLTHRRWLRALLLVPAVLVALLWAVVGVVVVSIADEGGVVARADAPGGSYRAVVRVSYAHTPDPSVSVALEQTGSLAAREFVVGCINGDDPAYTFREVRWADAMHLVVRLAQHTATVRVDPATGAPGPVDGQVWSC